MKPNEPNGADQTLLPNTPAKAPAANAPIRPTKPVSNNGDSSSHPVTSDATIDLPTPPPSPPPGLSVDPNETLAHTTNSVGVRGQETPGIDATLLPTSISVDVPKTVADASASASADAGATLEMPVSRTQASRKGSSGPLGSDTAPISVSTGFAGRRSASPATTGTMVGRFALMDLHASGGLGEVFKARDTELNREVAVKRIKSNFADDAGSRRRFLSEAQLTAKLDHPGVVPVFGLVNDVRGRPCYAMRFIRGETLKDEIDRYHNQGSGVRGQESEKTEKPDATGAKTEASGLAATQRGVLEAVPRSVAFRHLLSRFIATCQAIAYAHEKRIIHRDIKPANIMVGSFGETLVVDWGLAKSLDDGADFDRMMRTAASSGLRHDPEATDLPSHMTMAGTAVGTPSYMAPEQAAGEIDKVGPRSDIYALGATLFVILTGKAPVTGKTTVDVLNRVRRGEYDPALKVNPDTPKPLDAIARKAMSLRPEDRYTSALELAADVEKWLSDEPVPCYQDPFFEKLARWARRNPARVATGVSLLIAGVLAAGGIAWAIHIGEKGVRKERDNVILAQKDTKAALDLVTEEQGRTKAALDLVTAEKARTDEQRQQAVAARNIARERYEKAVASYNVLVKDIDKRMMDLPGLQGLRKKLLEQATGGLQKLVDGAGEGQINADRTLVAAYRQMGDVCQLIGETAKAHTNFQKAVQQANWVCENAEKYGATPAETRDAERDLARSLDRLAGIYMQMGKSEDALREIEKAIVIFTALAQDLNDAEAQQDLAAAIAQRAKILMTRGNTRKALEDCEKTLAARRTLFEAAPTDLERKRDLATSLDALAGLQLQTGNTKGAVTNAQRSLTVRQELAKQLPGRTDVTRELADAYARLGEVHLERAQMMKAKEAYEEGLKVLKDLVEQDEQSVNAKADLAAMYGRLGQVQLRTGDIEEALANTKEGMELAVNLQQTDRDSAKAKRDLAMAFAQYGDALLAMGYTDDGIKQYEESQKILQPLFDADKASARAELDLARTLERLGDGRMAKNDMTTAEVVYRESVRLRKEVKEKDAGSTSAKRELAIGQYKLANAFCGQGKPGNAEAHATEATNAFIEISALDPESVQTQRDIALGYAKWGQILFAGGYSTSALLVWQRSLDKCEKLAKVDANNVQAKEDEAAAWERLANFYASLGHRERALAASRRAVDLWQAIQKGTDVRTKAGRQRLALAMLRFGDLNTESRELSTARDWYKKAVQEVEGDAKDPLLGPVLALAKKQLKFLDAVEIGLVNPVEVLKGPEELRIPALRTVAFLELRAEHPITADAVARHLAKVVEKPGDKFTVASIFAGCAATPRLKNSDRKEYAIDAVKYFKIAVDAGFFDINALNAPEWEVVRQHAPEEFAKVRRELEKKLKSEEK